MEEIQKLMRSDSDLGLLDLGANLGQFSLIVANMGHHVLAVEPYTPNLHRFVKAIQLAKLEKRITILKNGLSDVRGNATLDISLTNQGATQVNEKRHCDGKKCELIHVILLDDIVPYLTFKKAVMKIDIQNFEQKAFQNAEKLFNAIHITDIFMVWEMQKYYVSNKHTSKDKTQVIHMIEFLTKRQYQVKNMSGYPLDVADWPKWPQEVHWFQR